MQGISHVILILVLPLYAQEVGDSRLPNAADVRQAAAETEAVFSAFMRDSLEIRLGHLYCGGFCGEDHRLRMVDLAGEAASKLERVLQRQELIRTAIEAYEAPDWENLYGETGLWRTIYADSRKTRLLKCRIELHGAKAAENDQGIQAARKVLTNIESISDAQDDFHVQLLRSEALWLTGGKAELAEAELVTEAIVAGTDIDEPLWCRAILLRLALMGRVSASDFRRVAQAVNGGACSKDFELSVEAAFLELRLNLAERGTLLAKTTATWPNAQYVMGRAILAWLEHQNDLGRLNAETVKRRTSVEITLVLKAAHQSGAAGHREVLDKVFAAEQYVSPLALFVCAEACRQTDPLKAISCYVQAAKARQASPGSDSDDYAADAAHRAAELAYQVYYNDNACLDVARLAMKYYCSTAGNDLDEQLEYLYSTILRDAGPANEWRALCEQIASRGGLFSICAQLDLINAQLEQHKDDADVRTAQIAELERLIASPGESSEDRRRAKQEAMAICAKLLLERGSDGDLQKVLLMLDCIPADGIWPLYVLKSAALDKAGRTHEAVAVLDNVLQRLPLEAETAVSTILASAVESIELYQSQTGLHGTFVQQCLRLADFCLRNAADAAPAKAELLRAEILLASSNLRTDELAVIEARLGNLADGLRGDLEFLRCQARLLTLQSKYDEAFVAWADLRWALRDSTQSWSWWRAKFYELLCFLRADPDNTARVVHAIEILESAGRNIPESWAERLAELKANADAVQQNQR